MLAVVCGAAGVTSSACFLLDSAAKPDAVSSAAPTISAAAHTGNASATTAIGGRDQAGYPEKRQQAGGAEQTGAGAGVFGGLLKLLLRQAHFVSYQP